MSGTLMQVRDVTMRFTGLTALSEVSFDVPAGGITGIIGPNGAGKTTLFNVIAGRFRPSAGEVSFDGRPISGLAPDAVCRLGISRTYQTVRPFLGLTVADNVRVGLLYGHEGKRGGRASHDQELGELLAFVQLAGAANKRAEQLIPLERKRLELARALATHPRLLLLDELMAGLTPTETVQMMETIRAIHARGITVVLIEHVMKAVMGLSHQVIVLHHGEKIAEGDPEVISQDPTVIEAYLGSAA